MEITIYCVDAFTNEMFKGNPAAVCFLHKDLDDQLKQKIAYEIGYSETAFVMLIDQDNAVFNLQWFTPNTEIKLCGHATLATAKIIYDYYSIDLKIIDKKLNFQTKSGLLQTYQENDLIVLDFPLDYPQKTNNDYAMVAQFAGINSKYEVYECLGTSNIMFVIEDEYALKTLNPDFESLKKLDIAPFSSLLISAPSNTEFDFVSRCFAPWEAINEDPVTGSTHTNLGPYWSKRLNKKKLSALQLSKRQGQLFLEILEEHILIKGYALVTLEGSLINVI